MFLIPSLRATGDGGRPVCSMCTKRQVQCDRSDPERKFVVYTANPALDQLAQEVENLIPETVMNQSTITQQTVTYGVASEIQVPKPAGPTEDLRNETVAGLYHHYIEHLAAWYDLCEQDRPFASLVPVRALEVSVVFNAIIAFSAQHKALDDARYETCSTLYHSACISGLLDGLSEFNATLQEDYLVAACLLRSYEILKGISSCFHTPELSLTLRQRIPDKNSDISLALTGSHQRKRST
jgi:hypothetical protein